MAKVNWPASMTSSSTSRRCSALSRVAAEAQKTSMMRRRRRCWSMPNLLGRLKSTVRSQRVRRPWALSLLSTGGRPLLAWSNRASISAAERKSFIAGLTSLEPASRTVTVPVATCTRTVRPTLPAVAVAVTGMPACSESRAHGLLVARADLHAGAGAEHLRAADEDGVEARRRARRAGRALRSARARRARRTWPGDRVARRPRSGSTMWASPQARPRRHDERQPDARAQADADEHVARGRGRGELAHADDHLGRRGCRQISHPGRSGAAARRRPRASAAA